MNAKSSLIKKSAFATLWAFASASQAGVTIFSSQAAFDTATTQQGVDTFADFTVGAATPGPITRAAGAYVYTSRVSSSTFWGAGTVSDPWLSTNLAFASIVFRNFLDGVTAVGGNFFNSNFNGRYSPGDITLTAIDSSGESVTHYVVGATTGTFIGFASTAPLTSVTIAAVQPSGGPSIWPTVDNLTLALASPVSEPGTCMLLAAGLGCLGFAARRHG